MSLSRCVELLFSIQKLSKESASTLVHPFTVPPKSLLSEKIQFQRTHNLVPAVHVEETVAGYVKERMTKYLVTKKEVLGMLAELLETQKKLEHEIELEQQDDKQKQEKVDGLNSTLQGLKTHIAHMETTYSNLSTSLERKKRENDERRRIRRIEEEAQKKQDEIDRKQRAFEKKERMSKKRELRRKEEERTWKVKNEKIDAIRAKRGEVEGRIQEIITDVTTVLKGMTEQVENYEAVARKRKEREAEDDAADVQTEEARKRAKTLKREEEKEASGSSKLRRLEAFISAHMKNITSGTASTKGDADKIKSLSPSVEVVLKERMKALQAFQISSNSQVGKDQETRQKRMNQMTTICKNLCSTSEASKVLSRMMQAHSMEGQDNSGSSSSPSAPPSALSASSSHALRALSVEKMNESFSGKEEALRDSLEELSEVDVLQIVESIGMIKMLL